MFAKRKRCLHCNELLTVPVFKKHKDLFYDPKNRQWNRKMKPCAPAAGIEELDYEDDMIISDLLNSFKRTSYSAISFHWQNVSITDLFS